MRTIIIIFSSIIVLLVVFKITTFTTTEYNQALIIQFGKPVGGPISDAGLHFKKTFYSKC